MSSAVFLPTKGVSSATEAVETRLVDPEGDAEDLQPIRSVDHEGNPRRRRKSARRRGERSTNPHGVKRERLSEGSDEGARGAGES